MTARENWLRLIRNDNPGWIGPPWEAFRGDFFRGVFVRDPISAAAGGARNPDAEYRDAWGVTWMWPTGEPGATPYITPDNKALPDINEWKERVVFPPLDGLDWSSAQEFVDSVDHDESLTMCMITGGLFERSHYLMGFEDALCNYMLEPDLVGELLDAITEWKIGHVRRVIDKLQPDVIHFHDDWGSKDALFMSPEVWRAIIKPRHKRIVDAVKETGTIFMHHADCICEPIVEDMVEIGIDIWQGVIPQNDILGIQRRIGCSMALMGGIDAQIVDMPEADEQLIRAEVRRCIDEYCPAGAFLPCIPNIVPIHTEVAEIYDDELRRYGHDWFVRRRAASQNAD